MRNILLAAVATLAIMTGFLVVYSFNARQNDMEQHRGVAHGITLAEGRIPQAREFFNTHRHYFTLLSNSPELFYRQVTILSNTIVSVTYSDFWRRQQWHSLPWLDDEIIHAAITLINTDEPGVRDASIRYTSDSMGFALFGTPLHLSLPGQRTMAWVSISYGQHHEVLPDRRNIHTEPLDSGFSLIITAELLRNEARLAVIITVMLALLTLATLAVLIWGIKTYKFIQGPDDSTPRTMIILSVVVVAFLVLAYIGFTNWL